MGLISDPSQTSLPEFSRQGIGKSLCKNVLFSTHFIGTVMQLLFLILYYIAHNATVLAYLFMFVLFAGLGSPIYPDDFHYVEVKDEPLEQENVSCEHMQQNFILK